MSGTERVVEAWAFVGEDGRLLVDSRFESEEDTWRIALGWPTHGEVKAARLRGCRVERVKVRIVEPAPCKG